METRTTARFDRRRNDLRGIAFNLDGVDKATADLELRLADAKRRVLDWFGNPPDLNLNSPDQLLVAFQAKGHDLTSTSEGAALLLEYRNIRDKELKFLNGLSTRLDPTAAFTASASR